MTILSQASPDSSFAKGAFAACGRDGLGPPGYWATGRRVVGPYRKEETMNQIILQGGIALPETSRDKYACWEDVLTVEVEMIYPRVVMEERGRVWRVSYSYDYMGNDLMRQALAVLRSGAPFLAQVLPDSADSPITSSFILTQLTQPTFAFSRNGKPFWHNFGFTLREEEPHGA